MKLFLLLFACFVSIQEENVNRQSDRLSPAPLKRRASYEIEVPEFLDDRHIVESPEKVLDELKSVQQKSWEDLETVKGRAWMNWIQKEPNKRGTISLLEFAVTQSPSKKSKLLNLHRKKALQEHREGKVSPGGHDPDDEEEYFCLSAQIYTSEMCVQAFGFEKLGLDEVDIKDPQSPSSEILDFQSCLFQYKTSPREFFETELPDRKKRKYKVEVKAKGDFVEISTFHPKSSGKPTRRWLFDISKNGSAVYAYQYGTIYETEFQNVDGHWIPNVVVKRSRDEYSEIKIFDLVINSKISDDEFKISSLPLRKGRTMVNDKRRKPTPRKQ